MKPWWRSSLMFFSFNMLCFRTGAPWQWVHVQASQVPEAAGPESHRFSDGWLRIHQIMRYLWETKLLMMMNEDNHGWYSE